MKNYLVILVTIGIGAAYWYQIPEPPKVKEEVAVAAVATPAPKRIYIPSHSSLDEPSVSAAGHKNAQSSVLIGNDKPSHLHP